MNEDSRRPQAALPSDNLGAAPAEAAHAMEQDWARWLSEVDAAKKVAQAAEEALILARNRIGALKRVRDLRPGQYVRVRGSGLLHRRAIEPAGGAEEKERVVWDLADPSATDVSLVVVVQILADSSFPEGAGIEARKTPPTGRPPVTPAPGSPPAQLAENSPQIPPPANSPITDHHQDGELVVYSPSGLVF